MAADGSSHDPAVLDPAARAILDLLAARAAETSISPSEAARLMAERHLPKTAPPEAWRRYLPAVKQQALHLARRGKIAILRKGRPVDPTKPVKGVVRLALPRPLPDAADAAGDG